MREIPAYIEDALRSLAAEEISYSELADLEGFASSQRGEPCIICGSAIDAEGNGHDEGCMGASE